MGLLSKLFGLKKKLERPEEVTPPEDAEHGPQRIKEYKAVRELGSGAEGYVSEMIKISTGKHYAVKAIRRSEKFKPKELTVLSKLRHPNVVELVDWFATKNHYYLVFELATGGELLDRVS